VSTSRQYVLCFSKDDLLVETRRLLLQHAGYRSIATRDELTLKFGLLSGDVSLLVLCHTLSSFDITIALQLHRETRCTAPILTLVAGVRQPRTGFGLVYDTHQGPDAFLATVEQAQCRLSH